MIKHSHSDPTKSGSKFKFPFRNQRSAQIILFDTHDGHDRFRDVPVGQRLLHVSLGGWRVDEEGRPRWFLALRPVEGLVMLFPVLARGTCLPQRRAQLACLRVTLGQLPAVEQAVGLRPLRDHLHAVYRPRAEGDGHTGAEHGGDLGLGRLGFHRAALRWLL